MFCAIRVMELSRCDGRVEQLLRSCPMNAGTSLGSVVAAFRALWKRSPERPLFTFVDDHGRDGETITAAALGGALPGWGFQPGDRALLVHRARTSCVLLGCLAAGGSGRAARGVTTTRGGRRP